MQHLQQQRQCSAFVQRTSGRSFAQLGPTVRGGGAPRGHHHASRGVPRPTSASAAAAHHAAADVDVVALGNLCVDVVLPVPELPAPDTASRRALLQRLAQQGPQVKDAWEVGGNCNFMIAAARLGMHVSSVGHVGDDVYGQFMSNVLQDESIPSMERILSNSDASSSSSAGSGGSDTVVHALDDVRQTLVCYVLVDPHSKHAFCSRYDFGPWPLLGGMVHLPPSSLKLLQRSRAVFTNGFVFDELPLEVVRDACTLAIKQGTAVFFDPGPRCFTMLEGQRRQALDEILDLSEVVLMTEEEAVTVTGHTDPELAARAILARPRSVTQWCVVKLGAHGALLVDRATGKVHTAPGFKVTVADTVGCGDSFAAAIVKGYLARAMPEAVLTLANAVGAATATGRGAGRNVASADKVAKLLREAEREVGGGDTARRQQLQAAIQVFGLQSTAAAGAAAVVQQPKQATSVH